MYFPKTVPRFEHRFHGGETRKFSVGLLGLIFKESVLQTRNFELQLGLIDRQIFYFFLLFLRVALLFVSLVLSNEQALFELGMRCLKFRELVFEPAHVLLPGLAVLGTHLSFDDGELAFKLVFIFYGLLIGGLQFFKHFLTGGAASQLGQFGLNFFESGKSYPVFLVHGMQSHPKGVILSFILTIDGAIIGFLIFDQFLFDFVTLFQFFYLFRKQLKTRLDFGE